VIRHQTAEKKRIRHEATKPQSTTKKNDGDRFVQFCVFASLWRSLDFFQRPAILRSSLYAFGPQHPGD
jgi:hypothetical protein